MTAHHGRNSPEDMYALEPARCVTARTGISSASSDQTFALDVLPIQNVRGPRTAAQHGAGVGEFGDPMFTLTTRADHAVFAFDSLQVTSMENRAIVEPGRPAPTVTRMSKVAVAGAMRPRKLTPREVERLFGFADDYTAIPVGKRKKKPAKDGPRYHALGNSMAVPVLAWIGRRLKAVDELVGQRDSLTPE